MNENFRKYPIKFYQTGKDVYYDNGFIQGHAKDLNDAFNQVKKKLNDYELLYFYDDVSDVKFGAYEPALQDKETKEGLYLGKLNLELDVSPELADMPHSVQYLKNNPDKIKDHEKFVTKIKNQKKRDKFLNDLKQGIKKVKGFFEMFSPYKTREDLICEHCGEIIPVGTYYEEWKRKDYHLECIWDKLCNDKKYNTHEDAERYFLSLQDLLSDWPGNLDCQDDYESDLELYKSNQRKVPV